MLNCRKNSFKLNIRVHESADSPKQPFTTRDNNATATALKLHAKIQEQEQHSAFEEKNENKSDILQNIPSLFGRLTKRSIRAVSAQS